MTESLERRIRHDPLADDPDKGDVPLDSDVPAEEQVDAAQEADDLDQDPDAVPNRAQEADPPTPERVGPWDDEELED